jgi:hypothetical protein
VAGRWTSKPDINRPTNVTIDKLIEVLGIVIVDLKITI